MIHFTLLAALLAARETAGAETHRPSDAGSPRTTDVRVASAKELREALAAAKPGTCVLVAPGDYENTVAANITGTDAQPITLTAQDPEHPPVFRGGLQFSDVVHFHVEHVVVAGAPHNGLNVDDGGTFDTPSHHVVLRDVVVRDCGGRDNEDGIKLSGVDDFRLEGCTVERWGRAGSAVDMVGCHRGTIVACTFRDRATDTAATGVQMKGGTRDVTVRACRFDQAGDRAVHVGGSTGLAYFRPRPETFEAKDVTVEGCTFVGSMSPIAFTGVDGAVVCFNTFVRPSKWCARILQETREPGFVPCRNGRFVDNLVVYRSDEVVVAVNVGPATAPETFEFARNYWYCIDDPKRAAPRLPTTERDAVVGGDPLFLDADKGDFRLDPKSPARGHGADALPKHGK